LQFFYDLRFFGVRFCVGEKYFCVVQETCVGELLTFFDV
jgi:hypothetical protein